MDDPDRRIQQMEKKVDELYRRLIAVENWLSGEDISLFD